MTAAEDSEVSSDGLLFPEQVAALMSERTGRTVSTRTVVHYLSEARRNARRTGHRSEYDLPEPVDQVLRSVLTGGGETRWVRSSRWDEQDIRTWLGRREGRPPAPRARSTVTGQFLARDEPREE
jgi:hypothetical protein